ncbi:MAG: hypothetical protein CSA81_05190 [Acidobacteria bacterium]|nr:MAG: hypothetical protein CSA81_05190 [Acidobacteriota bacterium]
MKNFLVNVELPQWILPAFALLAIVFVLTPGERPEFPAAAKADSYIEQNRARNPHNAAVYQRRITSVNAYECNDCHQHFLEPVSTGKQRTIIGEHTQITFKHGPEKLCFDCHNRENRMTLIAPDGSNLPFNRAEEMCISCHGIRYRDWKEGLHGKTVGFWDPSMQKESDRLHCLDCHDPHAPSVHDLKPAPPPHRPGPLTANYHDTNYNMETGERAPFERSH